MCIPIFSLTYIGCILESVISTTGAVLEWMWKNLNILGGGAKSDIYCSISVSVPGCEVIRFESSEIAACGAAIRAAVGSGLLGIVAGVYTFDK